MRLADLLERDADRIAQVQVVAPPLGDPLVEQRRERGGGPGHRVHPVRDRVDRIVGEHGARHVAVAHRHAVDEPREVQREVRHVQHPLVHPARALEQRHALVAEHVPHHLERELVVAGRHRRVRREDAALAHRFEVRVVELEVLTFLDLPLEQLEREERRVPLVQMVDRPVLVAHLLEQRRAAHAEHDLLTQPIVLVAPIQRVGERAVPIGVLREHRVEEEHRHFVPAHIQARTCTSRPSIVTELRASTGSSTFSGDQATDVSVCCPDASRCCWK